MKTITSTELPDWITEQIEELLANYRSDIRRHLDRIEEASIKIDESSDQLLEEVVIDGELTVPGSAAKLANRLKGLASAIEIPEEITYSSVKELLDSLEVFRRDSTLAGRRYIPRLPKVHKRVIKELDYQVRTIDQSYQKVKKTWEKNKLPKQLDLISDDAQELKQRSEQLTKLVKEIKSLRAQKAEAAGKIEEQQEDMEQFRQKSGLDEIEDIRRDVDSIRMIVTNQLNFLKKPFRKLSQAAGESVMIPSTAGEGADAFSKDAWQAFQKDTVNLDQLKAALTALSNVIDEKKLKFKPSVSRKVLDRKRTVCDQGALDEYRQRYANLVARSEELTATISVDERRDIEKSLERARWEHRDTAAEITHNEEQIARISERLLALQRKLERELSRLTRDETQIEFPEEVQAIIAKD